MSKYKGNIHFIKKGNDESNNIKMTELEQILNDGMALRNISDADPLHHNYDECRHQIVILF